MAACLHLSSTPSTANASSYASSSFTPTLNDLLVVFVMYSSNAIPSTTPTLTDSQGLGFTRAIFKAADNSGSAIAIYVANAKAAATAMTVTFNPGGACTGAVIEVARVTGMSNIGAAAVKNSGAYDRTLDASGSTTPFVVLSGTTNPSNPVLVGGLDVGSNPSLITAPSGWTQRNLTGYSTPTIGASYSTIDSGYTNNQITSGGSVSGRWQYGGVELDAGSVANVTNITLAATITLTCALVRKPLKTLSASTTFIASLTNGVKHFIALAANLSCGVVMNRKLFRAFSTPITLSPVMVLVQKKSIVLQASIINGVTLTKRYTGIRILAVGITMSITMNRVDKKFMNVPAVCNSILQKISSRVMDLPVVMGLSMTQKSLKYKLLQVVSVFTSTLVASIQKFKFLEHGKVDYSSTGVVEMTTSGVDDFSTTGTIEQSIAGRIDRPTKGRAD